jgi:hypothetical protein
MDSTPGAAETGQMKFSSIEVDAFNSRHETVFGFRILPDNRFKRIAGLTEYNKTTVALRVSPLFVESVQEVGFVIVAWKTLSGTISSK